MKAPKTKPNLNLHLHGIRGSIEILVPGRLCKALDLGTDRLAKGVYLIPQLHPIYLRFGYALILLRHSRRAASCSQCEAMSLGSSSSSPSSSESV